MNNLQLFNFEGNEVRTLKIDDEPYFVGKDVTKILGYKNSSKALSDHVDEEDKLNNETLSSLGQRGGWLVNESGLYSLILSSKMPNARKFKRWVTSEVLPAIRKHGAYMTDEKAFDVVHNKDGLADLLQQAADQLKEKDIQIAKMKPKALFADAVASSKSTVLIGDLAKMIKQNGVHYLYIFKDGLAKRLAMGPNNLFKWMRQNHWLIARKGSDYNSPTQKSMSMGLFEIKEKTIVHSDGHTTISKTPKVTGKGQQFFINLFLNAQLQQKKGLVAMSKKLDKSINQLDDLESLISDALLQTMDLKKTLQKINDFEVIKQEGEQMVFNIEALKKLIRKIVHEVVTEELYKRGNTLTQKMFNRKDAAKYLGVSGSYIDKLVKTDQLDPTLPGDGLTKFYLREDLDKFAESGKSYLKRVEK